MNPIEKPTKPPRARKKPPKGGPVASPSPSYFAVARQALGENRQLGILAQRGVLEAEPAAALADFRGLPAEITNSTTYQRLFLTLAKVLYLQSVATGNIAREKPKHNKNADKPTFLGGIHSEPSNVLTLGGVALQMAFVKIDPKELAQQTFGTDRPTARQRQDMHEMLMAVSRHICTLSLENRDVWQAQLWAYFGGPCGGKYRPYVIALSPVFCYMAKGFALLPCDFIERLGRIAYRATTTHFLLLALLAQQRKDRPYVRHFDRDFIDSIGLHGYDRNPAKQEASLKAIIDDLAQLGLVISYYVETRPLRGQLRWAKITFALNPAFGLPTTAIA